MSDILFVIPPLVNYDNKKIPASLINTSFFPPIGVAYLAAFLEKNNFKTKIIEMDVGKLGLSEIPKIIEKYKPRIVGVSINSDAIYSIAVKVIKKIREKIDIPIIGGGIFPTYNTEMFLKKSQVDIVVRGEGEKTLFELMEYYIFNKGNLSQIKGISYKVNGKITHNPERELIRNLDEIPFPAWYKFTLSNYFFLISYNSPSFGITTSRGCPYNCTFCASSNFPYYRNRSPKNVADEIEFLISNYNVKDIVFHDSTFNVNPKWVITFCKELLNRKIKIKWRCSCRPDQISENLVAYMKAAGCYNISFGPESSQNKFLKFLNKQFTIEQVERAFKIVKKFKIENMAFFIFGIPGQKISDIKQNFNFIKKIDPDYINICILVPFTGTKLYDFAQEKGWLSNFDMDSFSEPELFGTKRNKWSSPNILPEKIVNYYRTRTLIFFIIRFKTLIRFTARFIKKPSRLLNTFRTIIRRFLSYS